MCSIEDMCLQYIDMEVKKVFLVVEPKPGSPMVEHEKGLAGVDACPDSSEDSDDQEVMEVPGPAPDKTTAQSDKSGKEKRKQVYMRVLTMIV